MCIQTAAKTKPTPKRPALTSDSYQPTRDGCTWLDADPADLLRDGEVAMLRICKMRIAKQAKDGSQVRKPYVEIYLVAWDAARCEWTLTRDDKGDGSGAGFKTYRLDLDFGDCTCEAAQAWTGVRNPCKHVLALTAALKAIGVAARDPVAKAGAA